MLRLPAILTLAIPVLSLAADPVDAPARKNPVPAISLLPPGSRLKGVMLPRYDEKHQLVAVLKSELMTLESRTVVSGKVVAVEMFNPDQTPRGRADLLDATYDQEKGLIKSEAAVTMHSDRMSASGTGLHYLLAIGKGFMRGPATTTIQLKKPDTETTMNLPQSPLRATAAIGLSLLSQGLLAAPPPPVTEAEKAAMAADAVSRKAPLKAAGEAARESLKTDEADAATASKATAEFLVQADIPAPDTDEIRAPDKPLEVPQDPLQTVIHCDGGFYFDPTEGVLVYLKNVTVKDPRFDLRGLNELKIFFAKKEPKVEAPNSTPPSDKKPSSGFGEITANFGNVERIVGTGAVVIDQKPADGKEPVHASGATFTYNLKTDQVILSGGYPWVVQGPQRFRAADADAILRIQVKESRFDTLGRWDTHMNLGDMKKN